MAAKPSSDARRRFGSRWSQPARNCSISASSAAAVASRVTPVSHDRCSFQPPGFLLGAGDLHVHAAADAVPRRQGDSLFFGDYSELKAVSGTRRGGKLLHEKIGLGGPSGSQVEGLIDAERYALGVGLLELPLAQVRAHVVQAVPAIARFKLLPR
jgi:hypothetical protein